MGKQDLTRLSDRYNGGLTEITAGLLIIPLPYPEHNKKWAVRLYDAPGGKKIPQIVQVDKYENSNAQQERYPKFEC